MKQRCVREVSRALGRRIDGVEAHAIEAHIVKALREDARDRATWSARTGPERVQAAGARLADDALKRALAARAALGERGRRLGQPDADDGAAAWRRAAEKGLPMEDAARLERARAMGADVAEWEAALKTRDEAVAAADKAKDDAVAAAEEAAEAQRASAMAEADRAAQAEYDAAVERAQNAYDETPDAESAAAVERASAAFDKAEASAAAARDTALSKAEERADAAYERAVERAEEAADKGFAAAEERADAAYEDAIGDLDLELSNGQVRDAWSDPFDPDALGQGGQGASRRGETFIPEGGVFAEPGVLVSMFETADRSTPFHEFGHVFRFLMQAYAERANAPVALTRDWQAVLDWFAVKHADDITEAHEEQFARAMEVYAMEGRAPSPGLKGYFEAFARWFSAIYNSVLDLDVELTPEIRAVFDRLLKDPDNAEMASVRRGAGADPSRAGIRAPDDGARHDGRSDSGSDRRPAGGRSADGAGGEDRAPGAPRNDAPPTGLINPAMAARDPELKAIAGELAETRAELDALERQGAIAPEEAAAARADLERVEKAALRPELLRAAAFCLMHGARVNVGGA